LCGQQPMWNGKQLVLILDHINGINNDNRLENLRLLCPNCNSQTPTFAGRNAR
jgi:5-methylcytosine-specific restriction endonuclease McrA